MMKMRSGQGLLALLGAASLFGAAHPALAEGPEQFYEAPPEAGSARIEYNGQIGSSASSERAHSAEIFFGVSDRLAIGAEVETEVSGGRFRVDEIGIGALYRFTGDDGVVSLAGLFQAGVTSSGDFPQIEGRLITEYAAGRFRLEGNAIVRAVHSDEKGSMVGFAASAHREVGRHIELGVETSGQIARLSGFKSGFDDGYYAGPSIRLTAELADERAFEFGLKFLRRIDAGGEHRNTLRLAAGFEF